MLSNLFSYWQFGTTYCSVEVVSSEKVENFFLVCAKKKKGEFVDFVYEEFALINKLSNKQSKNQHLYLIINTDKVLIREIPNSSNRNNLLSNAFPGLNYTEFYYSILTTDKKSFVSVCRKDYVHNLIDTFNEEKIDVIGFELGFASLTNIISSLDEYSIETNKFRFHIENGQIQNFDEIAQEPSSLYRIDTIEIPSKYLLALSGLMNYVSEAQQLHSNYIEANKSLKRNQSQKNFFRKGIVMTLGILLSSLLINTMYFSNYFKKQQVLEEESLIIRNQQNLTLLKKEEIESKERLVENILNNENSKSSFYINRIISNKPATIVFNEIEYQPLEKAIRAEKKIEYTSNQMKIKGLSSSKSDFISWLETLENETWLASTLVRNYAYSTQNNSSFELCLILNPDVSKK